MSNFMDFLNNLDEKIINETYVNDIEDVEEVEIIQKPRQSFKKDASVKLIEKRMRNKLDSIGLNDKAIGDIVSYVLEDVQKISGIKTQKKQKKQKSEPNNIKPSIDENNTIIGRAETLLEGLPDTPYINTPQGINNTSSNEASNNDISDIADHASSLL